VPRPLFEVDGLRIAVFDQDRSHHGVPGPVTETGEELPGGWVEVIGGLSYHVHEGEVLALIGESASGKSLALMGAFGLLAPGARVIGGEVRYGGRVYKPGGRPLGPDEKRSRKDRKEARVSGTVIADYGDDEFARLIGTQVGFVYQNPIGSWTPTSGIGEQSGEALDYHTTLTHDEITERVLDALGEVRLPRSRRMFGAFRHELSRGMAQRAMLAAALTKAPKLLVADEPLNGLDPSVGAAIMDLIRDMQQRRSMAMVLVTHDLAAVASIADRVAVLYGGEIIEEATAADLYHRPEHPYTSGLLGSIPGARPGRLRPIPGEAPRLVDIDHRRCVFAGRCEHATEICRSTHPELVLRKDHATACHHAVELELPGIGTRDG
jgi:oligopeptide/dipeptide ABC transporter ATP-binding protein